MIIKIPHDKGAFEIAKEVVEKVTKKALEGCYGIGGLAGKGVVVEEEVGAVSVRIHLHVIYGVKISEVARNVQRQVSYLLQETCGIPVDAVHIFVEGVKVKK